MRTRARVDGNHTVIVQALEALGWTVFSTTQLGRGFPDILCAKCGRLILVEIKDGAKPPSHRKLTPDEQSAHVKFRRAGVHVHVVQRVADLAQIDREARNKLGPDPPFERRRSGAIHSTGRPLATAMERRG